MAPHAGTIPGHRPGANANRGGLVRKNLPGASPWLPQIAAQTSAMKRKKPSGAEAHRGLVHFLRSLPGQTEIETTRSTPEVSTGTLGAPSTNAPNVRADVSGGTARSTSRPARRGTRR